MSGRARRALAAAAGVALVLLALWIVGVDDRVVDAKGTTHRGRLVARGEDGVVLATGEGDARFAAQEVRTVRVGLLSAFRPLGRHPATAAAGLAAHLLSAILVHLRWGILLARAGLRTPLPTVLELGWSGQFAATLLPGGVATGDVVKAYQLARLHRGRAGRALVTVFFDRALALTVLSAVALAGALAAPGETRLAASRVVVALLFAGGLLFLALLFSPRLRMALRLRALFDRLPFEGVFRDAAEALALYGGDRRTLLRAGALSLVSQALLLLAFALYAAALGERISLFAATAAIPVAQMLAAVPGLPGGFGIGDLAFVAILPAAGVPAGTALALSFTYRVLHALISLPAGLWFFRGREPPA